MAESDMAVAAAQNKIEIDPNSGVLGVVESSGGQEEAAAGPVDTALELEAVAEPETEESEAEREADRDSLVPGTGSINGDIEEDGEESEEDAEDEEVTEEEEEEEDMSNVVQGTTETILNKLEENLAAAPEVEESDLLCGAEPGPLAAEGRDIEQVLSIISNSIYREGEGQIFSKLCDRSALLSVVSHSLSAYITTLESVPLQRLSSRIASEVSLWTCELFRFPGGLAHCHDDIREGLVRTVRLVLHSTFPELATQGFIALAAAPPVIYITSATYSEVAEFVCQQLGLPLSSARLVPPDPAHGFTAFQAALAEDRAAGRTPLCCVANVHSTLFQQQSVCELQAVCRQAGLWLHLEGHALAALALLPIQAEAQADSVALTLGSWVGIPALPFVTLYRALPGPAPQLAGLNTISPAVRLNCLPLWCVLRSLGQDQVRARVRGVFSMLERLSAHLAARPGMRLLSQAGDLARPTVTTALLESGQAEPGQLFNTVSPALAFQYCPSSAQPADPASRVPAYTDNLNSWLGQILQRDAPQLPVEIVDVETTGYVLRLCPFEDVAMIGLAEDEVEAFLQCVDEKCDILDATVTQRSKFIQLIEQDNNVQHVDIAHWAGLGGVRYLPAELVDKQTGQLAELTEEDRQYVDQRNMELVATLRNSDSAFSLGEGPPPDRVMCVRFGMVTMETEVEELLNLVINTGRDIDEAVSQLQTMSEVVRKGVEQAQDELRAEADNKLWQEGILRHVPIVGSFYNWLSPVPDDAKVKGRTLSLTEGKLESTEKIYKHHMQIHIEDGQEL